MNLKRSSWKWILFLSPVLMLLLIAGAGSLFVTTTEKARNAITEHKLEKVRFLGQKIDTMLQQASQGKIAPESFEDDALRRQLEDRLSDYVSQEYRYIFVLYQDRKGEFRFLLDGAPEAEERAEFGMKMTALEPGWEQVFQKGKSRVIEQKNLEELWMTYLHPIKQDGVTKAVLAVDFSQYELELLEETIEPVMETFRYSIVFLTIILLLAYLLLYVNHQLHRRTLIDPLTRLHNRRYLADLLSKNPLDDYAVCMWDLDHFKRINDNIGHDAGDYILQKLSALFHRFESSGDHIIRYGGEEFLWLVKKKKGQASASDRMEQFREEIGKQVFHYENHPISLTASCGLNPDIGLSKNVFMAIKIADEQLYQAKRMGRNRISIAGEKEIRESHLSINDVKAAIEEGRFFCHFQPIVDLATHQPVKYESLARIRSEEGDIIYPGQFLEAIRNTQVYNDMTNAVLKTIIQTIQAHQVHLTMNLDMQDFMNDKLMEEIISLLESNQELAPHITFEILESVEIQDFSRLNQRIFKLCAYGSQVAIDDFGSGYANFSYLQHLHVDYLKIDGSLIRNIGKDGSSDLIVRSIANMAADMNITAVAEYVSDENIMHEVSKLGIPYAQGYYFGKPSEEILKRNHSPTPSKDGLLKPTISAQGA